ncbi:MAG: hypothetical protein KC609_22605, partial [Myxococcales bacterium]|nr:hypothetical protein [Myxococcales bacterium]
NVYHPQHLLERLRAVKKQYNFKGLRYRLIPSEARRRSKEWDEPIYDLQVLVSGRRRSGLILNIEVSSEYGLLSEVGYRHYNLGLRRSEFDVVVRLGFDPVNAIRKKQARKLWTHAALATSYRFPSFWRRVVRPVLSFRTDISVFARSDVFLDEFYSHNTAIDAAFDFYVTRWLRLRLGTEGLFRKVFKLRVVEGEMSDVSPFQRVRGSIRLEAHFDFFPRIARNDRHTLLSIYGSQHFQKANDFRRLEMTFQHFFDIGHHDIIVRTRGYWLFGHLDFIDLVGIAGRYMRTFFDGRYYTRQGIHFTLEARISAYRDIIKFSIFSDTAVFGRYEQLSYQRAVVATAFGPGFHWLILHSFQLDAYYSFGFAEKRFAHNIYLLLRNVFD